jgi:hypothetical protein
VNRKHLHKIANQAAKNFLKLFMKWGKIEKW